MPNARGYGQNRAVIFASFAVLSSAIRGLPLERIFPGQHR
jgi:hypothetical protein